jgi:hypothetical protein
METSDCGDVHGKLTVISSDPLVYLSLEHVARHSAEALGSLFTGVLA